MSERTTTPAPLSGYTFRPATADDLPALAALEACCFGDPELCRQLGAPEGYPALAMLTTDCDDATYIALDAATKAAEVQVAYGRSFYAGAANASTPNAGEVIGILAGKTPADARSGVEAALGELDRVCCAFCDLTSGSEVCQGCAGV